MARTKNQRNTQRPSATPVMDPWDVEHQQSLAIHGPMASTNHIYPITVHRGFESQDTAEPFTRRYPAFQEFESHRAFLVRSRSERLITNGERDNYYTPEQLWEEDDHIRGTMQFARSGEASWVDEEVYSSDEDEDEEEAEGQVLQRNDGPQQQQPTVDPKDETDLPLTLQFEDHVTTVAAVLPDHENVQDFITSLDLSTTTAPLTISSTFMDGTIAVALCGQQKSHETGTEDTGSSQGLQTACKGDGSSLPRALDTDAADDDNSMQQQDADEWNVSLKDARLPTVSLLSGSEKLNALLAATDWDTETTIATVVKYGDGRVVVFLMGQQREKQPAARRSSEIEYGLIFAQFFQTVEMSTQHSAFTEKHKQLASLLETTRNDLVKADAIPDLTVAAQSQS